MPKNNKNAGMEKAKMKFFSDRPLTADKKREVRFGHLDIVANLQNILMNCPVPFTIGLFGKWGSGKTTIINVLEDKLKRERIAVVDFDVWKHEGDALRRTFLKESTQQLKEYLPKNFKLNERLKIPIRKTVENKIQWNKKFFFILCILVGASVGVGAIVHYFFPKSLGIYSSAVLGGGLVSAILIWVVQHLLVTETLTRIFDRFKDPHEFEAEFERIVGEVDCERLVFMIDNLDRCTHERAVELLSTMKTFLAEDKDTGGGNGCIFVIACDDEAIKQHLASVYRLSNEQNQEESFSPGEFLRKFFNTSLRIPQFIDTELETYTENLLEETGIPELNSLDAASVITTAFRDNPRQIKQFINVLIANFFLAKDREEREILPKGVVTQNVPFLARFLVIQQEYPETHREIQKQMLPVEEWVNIKKSNVKDFLKATKPVTTADIRPFVFLRQSEEEQTLPEIRELERALLDNDSKEVERMLAKIKATPDKVRSLGKCILSLMRKNKRRKMRLINIISSILGALELHNLELRPDFYALVGNLLNDEEVLKPELSQIEPSLVFEEVLSRCTAQDKKGIITYYVNTLDKQEKEQEISVEKAYSILEELRKHKDWLPKTERERIKTILASHYSSSLKILSLFESAEDQKVFISEETILGFIGTLSDGDVENQHSLTNKAAELFAFRGIFTTKLIQELIKRITELLSTENSKPFRPQKENFSVFIEKVLVTFCEQIENAPDDILNPFAEKVTQGTNAISDISQKRIFLLSCLKIYSLLRDEAKRTEINNTIAAFMQSADVNNLEFVLSKLSEEEKGEAIKRYVDIFNKRIIADQPVFVYLYPIAPPDVRTECLMSLINSAPERANQELQEFNYELDDERRIVEVMLTKAQSASIQEKEVIYGGINKMDCGNEDELRNTFASQIKESLKSGDENQQRVGFNALQGAKSYLSAAVKRSIVREVVDWLVALPPGHARKQYPIMSITALKETLEPLETTKRAYIDFLFDRLIIRGVSIDSIKLGFQALLTIQPRYRDHKILFDDTLTKTQTEGNEDIKKELKSGLSKLKSGKRLNKEEKDFWARMEQP